MVDIDIHYLRREFDKKGFVFVRRFIDTDQLKEISRRAEVILANRNEYSKRYTNITKGLEKVDDYFEDLMRRGPQVAILTELLGTQP